LRHSTLPIWKAMVSSDLIPAQASSDYTSVDSIGLATKRTNTFPCRSTRLSGLGIRVCQNPTHSYFARNARVRRVLRGQGHRDLGSLDQLASPWTSQRDRSRRRRGVSCLLRGLYQWACGASSTLLVKTTRTGNGASAHVGCLARCKELSWIRGSDICGYLTLASIGSGTRSK